MSARSKSPAARTLFGTDGVRGKANVHPMTPEITMALGMAIARHVRAGPRRHRIVIGKDTRLSGYMLEQALASGICSMGVDVLLCGPLPTPGISFLTHSMRADAGAVISASHNYFQDNGIKFFAGDGFKLPDAVEAELEAFVLGENGQRRRPTANRVGKAFRIDDAIGRYVVHLKNCFPADRTLDGIRMVVDCAHGAAYKSAPAVFEELGAQVIRMGNRPDGRNINRRSGALHPEKMARAVLRHEAQLGIALDGDADRVVVVDEKGQVVDGDALMAALSRYLIQIRALKRRTLVTTVMSNLALDHALSEVGGKVIRTQVGDRYVVERMRRGGFTFGGEQSGHLVFLQHGTTGDGTLAGLMVLAMMLHEGRPLSELVGGFDPFPQALLAIEVKKKTPLLTLDPVRLAIEKAEATLGAAGRVLVRYSGTEPKARVLVEGRKQSTIDREAQRIADAIHRAVGV